MKGPFERLKYDLRRLWECPQCKRRERSDGTVTYRFCACAGNGSPDGQRTPMRLLEEAGHRTVPVVQFTLREEPLPADPPLGDTLQGETALEPPPSPETDAPTL